MTKASVIGREALQDLISALKDAGYAVIGPRVVDGAVIHEPLDSAGDLPVGVSDRQEPGHYRLENTGNGRLFDFTVGPHAWKRRLHPPEWRLWSAKRTDKGFSIIPERGETPRQAFIGVRACDLHAMAIQGRVFDNGDFADPVYLERRARTFIVAVNCGRAGGTCFCASMGTGPKATEGFDLALTELDDGFLVETGSKEGKRVLAILPHAPATPAHLEAAEKATRNAIDSMGRRMPPGAAALADSPNHPRWDEVAARCLNCANCTMVCPTCFCTTIEDATDLAGQTAERWRRWDSCFAADFSYIHGGAIRRSGRSRYRQWITHKLSAWHDQFGSSGCVGCGRCITWCPVGIDITEEAAAIVGNT